ncbi:hypothetical protein JOD67_001428 [Tenggerimyces flavus]|nr:hypothetical protein [Tenggerimyces flavus]
MPRETSHSGATRVGQRTFAAAIALLVSLFTLAATLGPAHAAPASDTAPRGVASAAAEGEPATSPGAAARYFSWSSSGHSCPRGYACAIVRAKALPGWWVFKFYDYGTYQLHRWSGTGSLTNNQTGSAAMRLLGSDKKQRQCVRPGRSDNSVNWGPVYYIRLSTSGC